MLRAREGDVDRVSNDVYINHKSFLKYTDTPNSPFLVPQNLGIGSMPPLQRIRVRPLQSIRAQGRYIPFLDDKLHGVSFSLLRSSGQIAASYRSSLLLTGVPLDRRLVVRVLGR